MMKKTAVVTGGSSGIGFAIVKSLEAMGMNAVSWDLVPPADIVTPYISCDVTNEEKVKAAYKETKEGYGAPQILINNCGLQFLAPVDEFPLEKWNQLLQVMLTGTFLCSKHVIPGMKEKKWGRIVNISSIHGKVASPYKAAYVAAKHGVLGLAKVMALETAEFGITVNSICPGFVDTPLMRAQLKKQAELNQMDEEDVIAQVMLKPASIKEFTTTAQVAAFVKFLVSNDASTITGEAFNQSGGWGMGV